MKPCMVIFVHFDGISRGVLWLLLPELYIPNGALALFTAIAAGVALPLRSSSTRCRRGADLVIKFIFVLLLLWLLGLFGHVGGDLIHLLLIVVVVSVPGAHRPGQSSILRSFTCLEAAGLLHVERVPVTQTRALISTSERAALHHLRLVSMSE
jgi:hypothetical protein